MNFEMAFELAGSSSPKNPRTKKMESSNIHFGDFGGGKELGVILVEFHT